MELQGEELATPVGRLEHREPLPRGSISREPESLDDRLVVRDRHGDIHQAVLHLRGHRNASCVAGRVELERELVRAGASWLRIGAQREGNRLAAVVAEPEGAKRSERGGVVAKIRPAKARRL